MQKSDGMNYAPVSAGKTERAAAPGEFYFSVIGLDHGHIYGMTNGLLESGAEAALVYDPDPEKLASFIERYPAFRRARSEEEVIDDRNASLIASAIRPDKRAALGIRVMSSGKDYFSDKPGMLSLEETEAVGRCCAKTGRRYFIYFSERIHVEGAVCAEQLIREGAIGPVIHMDILAPHRMNPPERPDWFYDQRLSGGIITDLGSHQIEQFLTFASAESAVIQSSRIANYHIPRHPDFRDFGDCTLTADNGATCYFRVDWFTPPGLGAWGDGRAFIIGTDGYIEIRKYIDIAFSGEGDHVYLVDKDGERRIEARGKYGFKFFPALIRDCIDRTETAMTQRHAIEAMRLAIEAQQRAELVFPLR
ncbi:Gfo/Idh/MocA family oxidoreductase [Treponema sp. OttesenSCG-928-L16]|nr:Gfo/Idh/MocA family oxidoreductase [Treponema sp. OttesenSCG-928-L16]